jgi:hypothetical protein
MLNKMKKRFLITALLLLSITFSVVPASAYMLNWGFDPDGGGDTIITIGEYLDLTGTAHITNDLNTGTFSETGNFSVFSHDSIIFPVIPAVTAVLSASGTLAPGAFAFNASSNALMVYANDSTLIGAFDMLSGGGELTGSYGPNGWITANFVANSLASGYWFDDAGNDLSLWTLSENSPILTLGLATTNATVLQSPAPISVDGNLVDFYVSNNGQFRLDVIPEPATMFLFGAGLICIAGFSRKKMA